MFGRGNSGVSRPRHWTNFSGRENPSPMRVVNKLTKPGGIRRVDLTPDTVRIQTSDGQERVYKLASEYTAKEEGEDGNSSPY